MNDEWDEAAPWDGPVWDPKLAAELVGKTVLVGVTDLAADGAVVGHRQFHGHAIRADWRAGIALRLGGERAGEEIVLPPDTRAFRPAAPGEFRLAPFSDAAGFPDFLATLSVPARDGTRDH